MDRLSLLVASLSHDVDHRGVSNQFLQLTSHPLALLYPNSTMEFHHLETTNEIMTRHNSDPFCKLTDEQRIVANYLIRHAILATDLVLYFGNQARINSWLDNNQFDITNTEHRCVITSLQ